MAEIKRRLSVLVNDLTTTGSPRLDEANLRDLKSLCKNQDANVRIAFELIFAQLSKNHAQIRFSALQLSDELFRRSRVFRELLIDQLDLFLEKTVGIKQKSLPLPKPTAEKLQRLALETVEAWFTAFGGSYVKLALGFDFLKECESNPTGGPPISKILRDIVLAKEKEKEALEKAQRKYEMVLGQVRDHEEELREILAKMDNALQIVLPDPRASGLSFYVESSLQGHSTPFVESEDNAVVVETIKECRGLLDKRYDKLLDIWIEILSTGRHQPTDKESDSAVLKRLVHLKNASRSLLARYEALRLKKERKAPNFEDTSSSEVAPKDARVQSDSDDDEFEDVVEEDLGGDIPAGFIEDDPKSSRPVYYSDPESPPPRSFHPEMVKTRELTREEKLKLAPVVPYGPDLENWGKKDSFNVTTNSEMIESFWYRSKDFDAIPNSVKDATMKRRVALTTAVKPDNIKACRAPLKDGRVCERRDLEACPFHGPIINRNSTGQPVDDAGKVIPNHFPEKTFQRMRKELLEDEPPKKEKKRKRATKFFNEDLLNQWKAWEDDNRIPQDPPVGEEKIKGPGLEILHKKPVGASRVKSIINSRAARKETNHALDRQAEIARKDLLENQWRPY